MTADPEFFAGETLPASKLVALSPDPQPFTPVWTNITLGTGPTNQGYWWQVGREVRWMVELILGAGGDVTGTLELEYPSGAPAVDAALATLAVSTWWGSVTAGSRHAGAGVGSSVSMVTRVVTSATNAGWSAAQPADWQAGSTIRAQGSYIAAV